MPQKIIVYKSFKTLSQGRIQGAKGLKPPRSSKFTINKSPMKLDHYVPIFLTLPHSENVPKLVEIIALASLRKIKSIYRARLRSSFVPVAFIPSNLTSCCVFNIFAIPLFAVYIVS